MKNELHVEEQTEEAFKNKERKWWSIIFSLESTVQPILTSNFGEGTLPTPSFS